MAYMPGAPKGRAYSAGYLDAKVVDYGCFPGQEVKVERGLPKDVHPTRTIVVGEYPQLIVLRLEFDIVDDWTGEMKTTGWNFSIQKASLMCGEAILKDLRDRTIRPKEEQRSKPKRQSNYALDQKSDRRSSRNRDAGTSRRPPRSYIRRYDDSDEGYDSLI